MGDAPGYVWVAEAGDYEQRTVWCVGESPEATVAAIKAIFPAPYVVRWDEPLIGEEDWSIAGHFEVVRGKSTKHTAHWTLTRFELAKAISPTG